LEEVLGAHTEPEQFERFIHDWEAILSRRVDEVVQTFAEIPGMRGLILAGSLGRGEPWPLSDIDLLPIYERSTSDRTSTAVELRRVEPLKRWAREGWWSGIDIGSLVFYQDEVSQAFQNGADGVLARLQDPRWYHSVDKGYRGRAVYDPSGLASRLVQWFTENRFEADVTRLRLAHDVGELQEAWERVQKSRIARDNLGVVKELLAAVGWLRIWYMEGWGERDNSLARFGSRFEQVAISRGRRDLVDEINELVDLNDEMVPQRMNLAPRWVGERHERQWRARQFVGERVTRLQDARDVLRVSVHYALRETVAGPIPEWLSIPDDVELIDEKISSLAELIHPAISAVDQ